MFTNPSLVKPYFPTYLQLPSSGTICVKKKPNALQLLLLVDMKIELYQYLFSHCQFHRKDCWVSRTANVAWAFDSPFPKQPSNHKSPRTYCRLHLGDTNDIPENKVIKNTYKHQLGLPNATNPASDPGLGKIRSKWIHGFFADVTSTKIRLKRARCDKIALL